MNMYYVVWPVKEIDASLNMKRVIGRGPFLSETEAREVAADCVLHGQNEVRMLIVGTELLCVPSVRWSEQ